MLSEKFNEVKFYVKENRGDLFIATSFLLVALIAFGLGRLSAFTKNKPALSAEKVQLGALADTEGIYENAFVASKNGSVYYLPSCAGVGRIKEENKIWFSSREEAEKLGYKPAANCPGL